MEIYYPALVLSSIFFASIVVNLKNRNYGTVFAMALLAIPSLLFMVYLSQKNLDILAYALLAIPFVIIITGYEMGIKQQITTPTTSSTITTSSTNNTQSTQATPTPQPIIPQDSNVGSVSQCPKCNLTPCMCPYKPPA